MVSHYFTLCELSCISPILVPGPNKNISPVQDHLMPTEFKPKLPSDERRLELQDVDPEPDKNISSVQPTPAPVPLITHVEPEWPKYERERELWDRRTSHERYLSTLGFLDGPFNVSVPGRVLKWGERYASTFPPAKIHALTSSAGMPYLSLPYCRRCRWHY